MTLIQTERRHRASDISSKLEPICVCATQAEAALNDRVKHFEDENKQMTTVEVADNDIIDINIGGTIVSTKRSTLTQVGCCGTYHTIQIPTGCNRLIQVVLCVSKLQTACRQKGRPWLPDSLDVGNSALTGMLKAVYFWTLTLTASR